MRRAAVVGRRHLGRRTLSATVVAAVWLVGLAPGVGDSFTSGLGADILGLSIGPQLVPEIIQGALLAVLRLVQRREGAMGITTFDLRRATRRSIRRCFAPLLWLGMGTGLVAISPQAAAAQSALDRTAGIDLVDAPIERALRLLGRASGVAVIYSPDLLPLERIVTCRCGGVTVGRALEQILADTGLTFTGSERQVRIVPAGSATPVALTAVVTGMVQGSGGERVPDATIRIDDERQVISDTDGAFVVTAVRPGTHRLVVTALGWTTRVVDGLVVAAGDTLRLTLILEPRAISLADIRVAPGLFSALEGVSPRAIQVLTREEILAMPQVGEDVFRSLKRLPGIASHDISTKLHVRGGADREVLVRLDGVELYEPYHMKDWDGALGIVDLNALGAVELSAGGFGAEYGDRMTGVLDMRSRPAVGPPRTTLGLSVSNVTAMSRGGFDGGRGSWLLSGRRGFMGLVIRLIGEDERLSPQFWDVFGKLTWQPAPGNLVSFRVLHGGDTFGLHEADEVDRVDVQTDWSSSYGWVTWESTLRDHLSSDLTVWTGRVAHDRGGLIEDGGRPGMPERISANDARTFSFVGAREELALGLGDRFLIKLGAEAKRLRASYEYSESTWNAVLDENLEPVLRVDSSSVDLERDGAQTAAWAAIRARPWDRLTVELGVRHDRATHSHDDDLAPRVLAAIDLDSLTTLRGSWGWYHQTEGIHELAIGDGETEFQPSERTRQLAFGVERRLPFGITARAEVYSRSIDDQRPRHLNLEQELEVFPEAEGDRLRIDPDRGRARGLELMVEREGAGRWTWSLAYVLAQAEDEVPAWLVQGCADSEQCPGLLWVPRRFDQRHAVTLLASYSPDPRWTISAGWRYHSGWPATAWSYRVEELESGRTFWTREFGPVRELRLPAYHRLDLRVTRAFQVRGNPLTAFVDLFNAYDRTNLAGYEFGGTFVDGMVLMERRNGQTLLPFLPTFGLRYEF
jgi:hypothetical protein